MHTMYIDTSKILLIILDTMYGLKLVSNLVVYCIAPCLFVIYLFFNCFWDRCPA